MKYTAINLLLLLGLLACTAGVHAADAPKTLLIGQWELDVTQTQAIQPDQPQENNWFKNQNVRTSVNVAGMPLPNPFPKQGAFSTQKAKDPDILRCKSLTIEPSGDKLKFIYVDVGSEFRKQGSYRGAKIRWSKRKLVEKYKTTERKVTQTFEIKDNDQLHVTIKINPNKGQTRTYKQVFNRAS